ncbi:MAG: hypothetical protein CMQ46_13685 [Gammaproteobacteria bacterium]|nr:hypothetical protein [Gammaproteobacteria bacterium]MBJ56302.1 hypothetical protein [Gammaproteobacteria bacterium]HBN13497.1 hypothetical protein [Pseudohongiella sp.]
MNTIIQPATLLFCVASLLAANTAHSESAFPAPVIDTESLLQAIESMGYQGTITENNLLVVAMPDDVRLVGKFSAYPHEPDEAIDKPCGEITIYQGWSVTGTNAPAIRAFAAQCESGKSQNILPVIEDSAFHGMMAHVNLDYTVGNRYGSVNVKDVDVFLPDFYVLPLTHDDRMTLQASTHPSGVVLQIHSINDDQSLNYILLTSEGKQRFWGGQPTVIEGEFIRGMPP